MVVSNFVLSFRGNELVILVLLALPAALIWATFARDDEPRKPGYHLLRNLLRKERRPAAAGDRTPLVPEVRPEDSELRGEGR
jgi:hypothetical protein